ncbi:MAG: SLBB domain-containing protein [Candidatus Zixiibacteriota bacterium]
MILSKTINPILFVGVIIASAAGGAGAISDRTEVESTEPVYLSYDRPIDPDIYLIRPGEQISVTFVRSQLSSLTLTVSQEGKIAHSAIGLFDLSGKTLAQARALLLGPIAKVYNAPDIEISVGAPYRVTISISGAVAKPGFYRAYTAQRVSDLIDAAGGLAENASLRRITFSGGNKIFTVDLDRALVLSDFAANPYLYAGYHIDVPLRSEARVQVIGAVQHAREIELQPTDSLQTLLALAGGVQDDANIDSIRVIGDPTRHLEIPGGIRSGDVILVPRRASGPEDLMFLIVGEVSTPGRYPFADQSTLGRLIAGAGGLTARANTERVTVFRKAESDAWGNAPRERYPIRVLESSPEQSAMPLMPGDSILVPARVGYVRVAGSVRRPGLYPYAADKSAAYYVGLAGGETSRNIEKTFTLFDRASRTSNEIEPTTRISDGDEVTVSAMEIAP